MAKEFDPKARNRRRGKRALKIFLILLGVKIFFSLTTALLLNRVVEPLIRKKFEKFIVAASDGLYHVKMGDMSVNIYKGKVSVKDMDIVMDSTRYREMERDSSLPSITYSIQMSEGKMYGFKLLSFLLHDKIRIGGIVAHTASMKLCRHLETAQHSVDTETPVWKQLRPKIKGIYVDHIALGNVHLSYENSDSSNAFKWKFDSCYVRLEDFRVDSASAVKGDLPFFCKQISLKMGGVNLQTPDSTYRIGAKGLKYSSIDSAVLIEHFNLNPVDQKYFYSRKVHPPEMYTVDIASIRLKHFSLTDWIKHNLIRADSLVFDTPIVGIYADYSQPPSKDKTGKFPNQLLMKAPFGIYLDCLTTNDGRITYTEKNTSTHLDATLVFDNLKANISNVTNDSLSVLRDSVAVAELNATCLGTCQVHAIFHILLNSSAGDFNVEADASHIERRLLNPVMVDWSNKQLKSFDFGQLHFSMTGNEHAANGKLLMTYNNLSLDVLAKDGGHRFTDHFLPTFEVNNFALFPDNPGKNGKLRTALPAMHTRDPYQSFFSLIWHMILSGVKDTVLRQKVLERMAKKQLPTR